VPLLAAELCDRHQVDRKACEEIRRFGHRGDGGRDVCVRPAGWRLPRDCVVYSVGINHDTSFDEAIAAYGCEVRGACWRVRPRAAAADADVIAVAAAAVVATDAAAAAAAG
jgi:hypothetical protein